MDFSPILKHPDFPCSLISEPELQLYFLSSGSNQVHMWYSHVKVVQRWTSQPALWTSGIRMTWRLLPHISLCLAKFFSELRWQKYSSEVVQMHSDVIGTLKSHGFTLWGLSSIFQNVLLRDSEGMTSWLADGGFGGVYVHAVAHSRSWSTPVQRKIALGSGNSSSAQLLYNIIESNGWKWGFQLGTRL